MLMPTCRISFFILATTLELVISYLIDYFQGFVTQYICKKNWLKWAPDWFDVRGFAARLATLQSDAFSPVAAGFPVIP
ncbi:MAG: hypothetical protein ACLR9W_03160 [Enterobacter hormaechei]